MRGRNKKMQGMKLGRTIVAERERAESDSERMMARKKAHRKQRTSVVVVVLMGIILGLIIYMGVNELKDERQMEAEKAAEVEIRAQVIDEDNRGRISARTKTYIAQLEKDLADLGYTVTKVTLPTGMSRELYVDLEGKMGYFKVNLDRGTAVTAEDMDRMIRYLEKNGVVPEYVDVRVEEKAYYKAGTAPSEPDASVVEPEV